MYPFDSVSRQTPLYDLTHLITSQPTHHHLAFIPPSFTALDPTPATLAQFPQAFHLSFVVTLTAHELSTDLHVVNPLPSHTTMGGVTQAAQAVLSAAQAALPAALSADGSPSNTNTEQTAESKDLKFQALFHTYLRVSDSKKIKVQGLKNGLSYIDKVKGGSKQVWEGGDLTIGGEVDRLVAVLLAQQQV